MATSESKLFSEGYNYCIMNVLSSYLKLYLQEDVNFVLRFSYLLKILHVG